MSKHTPGPWLHAHREGTDGSYRTEVFSEQFGGIATCDWTPEQLGNGVTGTYREANARLIAAAPKLLSSLTALLARWDFDANDDIPPAVIEARAVVVGATGAAE